MNYGWQRSLEASAYLRKLEANSVYSSLSEVSQTALLRICDAVRDASEPDLIQAKLDFDYCWARCFIDNTLDQRQLGEWRTRFAEATIQAALNKAWRNVIANNKALAHLNNYTDVAGLFIVGMGKLGGVDLNFSSDIDLVAFFDPATLDVPDAMGKGYVAHQVLQAVTKELHPTKTPNFVWRVDWRLRPNASATSLAMSTEVARDYYFYHASPWHRLAMLKARVVGGDQHSGEQFLRDLKPFVWRRNLDFRALDELAEIKQRINLEHPGLRAQRQCSAEIHSTVSGFNVKLGAGGIREIEFIANALQLLWGGREHSLRTTNTLTALLALRENGRLEADDYHSLASAYQFLRNIENAIQLRENQQDHLVPSADSSQDALLILSGHECWADMAAWLNTHRRKVNALFKELFAEQLTAQGEIIEWPAELSVPAKDIVATWEAGFVAYGVSQTMRYRLKPLSRGLAAVLKTAPAQEASDVVIALHQFFKSLPSGEQYFRLLAESPELLDNMVQPLMHAPAMAVLLHQSPHIIDCFVEQGWQWPQPFKSDFVLQTKNYESRLEGLRRFVNESLYQLYLSFLRADVSIDALQQALTALAEHTIALSLKVVAEELEMQSVPIAVIGLGKLGQAKMAPQSDVDLIFVFDENKIDLHTASKFVSRLQTATSTPMREGIVYDLDSRLRPSGRAGAPTVSMASFKKHHLQRAHTWEHLALMPSRLVAGDPRLATAVDDVKRDLIARPRSKQQALNDVYKMWNRIEQHRIQVTKAEILNTKLRAGGLMQAEFLANAIILVRADRTATDHFPSFDTLLDSVLEDHEKDLTAIIEFWRGLQAWERLLGLTRRPIRDIPDVYLSNFKTQLSLTSVNQLIEHQASFQTRVLAIAKRFFNQSSLNNQRDIEQWAETRVQWL